LLDTGQSVIDKPQRWR